MNKSMSPRLAWRLCLAVMLGLLCVGAASAKPRPGTIEDLQPIENRGEDESEGTKERRGIGARIGRLAGVGSAIGQGLGVVPSNDATQAATRVAMEHGDTIGGEIAARTGGPGPATRYMVKVRLDSGRVLTITQLREQVEGLAIGSRVRVEGSGDSALVFAE